MRFARLTRAVGRWSGSRSTGQRSFASKGPDLDYNEPGGKLFPECYDENGVKQRQEWEPLTYLTYGLTFVLLVVGLNNKPESSLLPRELPASKTKGLPSPGMAGPGEDVQRAADVRR